MPTLKDVLFDSLQQNLTFKISFIRRITLLLWRPNIFLGRASFCDSFLRNFCPSLKKGYLSLKMMVKILLPLQRLTLLLLVNTQIQDYFCWKNLCAPLKTSFCWAEFPAINGFLWINATIVFFSGLNIRDS